MVQDTKVDSENEVKSCPAWTEQDLATDPHEAADKAKRVEAMFAAIAGRYDLNNRIHSLWLDQLWRRRAVAAANVQVEDSVVDVACGTGDLSAAFALAGARKVLGIDFTQGMLEIAKQKAEQSNLAIEYRQGDAMALDLQDESADILSIAFGIRNVQDPAVALHEFFRVLRFGGRLVVLEFSTPKQSMIRLLNNLYTKHIMPRTASFIAGDGSGAYYYLPKSVDTFLEAHELGQLVQNAGFSKVIQIPLTFGVCTLTVGTKSDD